MARKALVCGFVLVTALGRAIAAPASITGRVVDQERKPIHGALVVHLDGRETTKASTDERGHFHLSSLERRTGLLIVRKEGFHVTGQPLQNAGPQSSTLVRFDAPVADRNRVKKPAWRSRWSKRMPSTEMPRGGCSPTRSKLSIRSLYVRNSRHRCLLMHRQPLRGLTLFSS